MHADFDHVISGLCSLHDLLPAKILYKSIQNNSSKLNNTKFHITRCFNMWSSLSTSKMLGRKLQTLPLKRKIECCREVTSWKETSNLSSKAHGAAKETLLKFLRSLQSLCSNVSPISNLIISKSALFSREI